MAYLAHFDHHFFLILLAHGHGQPETDDHKVDMRAVGSDRRHPSTLASGLIADPGRSRSGKASGFAHRSHRIVGEKPEILAVDASRRAGPALVIDERTDALGRQHPLEAVVGQSSLAFRAVHQNDNRHFARARGHDKAAGKRSAVTIERHIRHVECDAMTGCAVKIDCSGAAIRK
jgi:hypothetical protein